MSTLEGRLAPTAGRQILDPRDAYPRPPFPRQRQELPGLDSLGAVIPVTGGELFG